MKLNEQIKTYLNTKNVIVAMEEEADGILFTSFDKNSLWVAFHKFAFALEYCFKSCSYTDINAVRCISRNREGKIYLTVIIYG